jgi:peptidoglycan/LPS O-acetylase OafA/YrhL
VTLLVPSPTVTTDRPTSLLHDPVARTTAVLGLVGVAAIHLSMVVDTVNQTPWLGAAFIALIVASVVLAAVLLRNQSPLVWLGVGALNVAAIGGYVFTRLASTFIDNQDVGNWSESLGLVALLIEGLLVVLSVYVLFAPDAASTQPSEEI